MSNYYASFIKIYRIYELGVKIFEKKKKLSYFLYPEISPEIRRFSPEIRSYSPEIRRYSPEIQISGDSGRRKILSVRRFPISGRRSRNPRIPRISQEKSQDIRRILRRSQDIRRNLRISQDILGFLEYPEKSPDIRTDLRNLRWFNHFFCICELIFCICGITNLYL